MGGLNLHTTAYFIATTVVVSQLSIIFVWYNNILQDYCKKSSIWEKVYTLVFPVIYIRFEVWRLNNVLKETEAKIKKSLKNIASDPSNQMQHTYSQYTKLVLKLNKTKEKALDAKRIHVKMLNLRLVFCNFPQSIGKAKI